MREHNCDRDSKPNNSAEEDPRNHPTYVGLINSVHKKAASLDGLIDRQNVHFFFFRHKMTSGKRIGVSEPVCPSRDFETGAGC